MVDIEPNHKEIARIYYEIHDEYEKIEALFIELKKYKVLEFDETTAMKEAPFRATKFGARGDTEAKK